MNWLGLLVAMVPVGLCASIAVAADVETAKVLGNPILSDGRYYSTDPAPFVDGNTLYILAGRDEAEDGVNDFIMREWQMLAATDPASGEWKYYRNIARPESVFAWAEEGRAYAGQIVKARNGRYYFYAPVLQRDGDAKDRFAIGVAVADAPTGPWRDAHPSGPIISQKVPVPNDIQNIDPTILIDDDGRVYIYWGTFGQLRGMELAEDMITPKGPEVRITGLTGFFEAPWIMKRKGVYYLMYAGNNAGPDSPCTPSLYHACQAYGTASSPLGPWTYRGVMLRPVSSTTSHAGAVEFKGQWYLAYHTADARGGGHFRRSVALDRLEWDDRVTPAAITLVTPTKAPAPPPTPTRNIAGGATVAVSNIPVPVQYWTKALNDGLVRAAPLPPDIWGTWVGRNPASAWIEYRWPNPVSLNGSRILFFADQPAGAAVGVAPPTAWHIEYWDGAWKPVTASGPYGTEPDRFQEVTFAPIVTRCLRAVMTASGNADIHAGLGVQEWEVLTQNPTAPMVAPARPAEACGP